MKVKILIVCLLAIGATSYSYGQKKKDKDKAKAKENEVVGIKLESRLDTISYCLGVLFGGSLNQGGFTTVNTKLMGIGTDDVLTKKTPLFDAQKANEIVGKYVMDQRKSKGDKNLKEGQAFLAKNKTEPGVITLPSGLQYKILKEGNGPKPDSASKVTVHYHGTLIDGKVFDSSVERGEPAQLSVNGVIEGWRQALPMMSVGSKWRLFIPSTLAYGENPRPGGPIEANMVLIFDVELISIDKDQPATQPLAQPETK
jgi:FKBP-type peptidyl-prolyl cis-trans isomerase FklB